MTLQRPVEELIALTDRRLLFSASRWTRISLGEVAEVVSGYAFQSRYFNDLDGFPLVRIRDLNSSATRILYSGPVPEGFWIEPGDLLVGLDGDFRLHRWRGSRALLNQRVARIRAHEVVYASELLELVLPAYLELLRDHTSSITVRHLSLKDLKKVPLPFPPQSEQHRILDKLGKFEERATSLESELSAAKAQTETAQESAYSDAFRPHGSDWSWAPLGEIANIKAGLALGRKLGPAETLIERPYLRVANVQRGSIDLSNVKMMTVRSAEVNRYSLAKGDILMNEGGDRDKLGRGWIWNGEIDDCLYQNHVFRVRLKEGVHVTPKFVSRYANYVGHNHFAEFATQTSNLASISARNVAQLLVPVPPPGHAEEIDRRLDALEASIDDISMEIARARILIVRLRAAVLSMAVCGTLTQPVDGDANAMLTRGHKRPLSDRSKRGKTRVQSNTSGTGIVSILRERKESMMPEQLFIAAGYISENVEDFYRELTVCIDTGEVEQTDDKQLMLSHKAANS